MRPHYSAAPERTALAWQRTATALIAGGAALARWAGGRIGWLALPLSVLAIGFAAAAMAASVRRSRLAPDVPVEPGATPVLVLAAVWLLGIGALVHVFAD